MARRSSVTREPFPQATARSRTPARPSPPAGGRAGRRRGIPETGIPDRGRPSGRRRSRLDVRGWSAAPRTGGASLPDRTPRCDPGQQRLVDVVGDEDDRLGQRRPQAQEFGLELGADDGVDGAEKGSSMKQDRRVRGQGPCHTHAGSSCPPESWLGNRSSSSGRRRTSGSSSARSLPRLGLGHARQPQCGRGVVQCGAVGEQARALDDIAHRLAQPTRSGLLRCPSHRPGSDL